MLLIQGKAASSEAKAATPLAASQSDINTGVNPIFVLDFAYGSAHT